MLRAGSRVTWQRGYITLVNTHIRWYMYLKVAFRYNDFPIRREKVAQWKGPVELITLLLHPVPILVKAFDHNTHIHIL